MLEYLITSLTVKATYLTNTTAPHKRSESWLNKAFLWKIPVRIHQAVKRIEGSASPAGRGAPRRPSPPPGGFVGLLAWKRVQSNSNVKNKIKSSDGVWGGRG